MLGAVSALPRPGSALLRGTRHPAGTSRCPAAAALSQPGPLFLPKYSLKNTLLLPPAGSRGVCLVREAVRSAFALQGGSSEGFVPWGGAAQPPRLWWCPQKNPGPKAPAQTRVCERWPGREKHPGREKNVREIPITSPGVRIST